MQVKLKWPPWQSPKCDMKLTLELSSPKCDMKVPLELSSPKCDMKIYKKWVKLEWPPMQSPKCDMKYPLELYQVPNVMPPNIFPTRASAGRRPP